MIYCDHHIEKAIHKGQLIVDPAPHPSQYDSSSLNLRVGDDFRVWKKSLRSQGIAHRVDLDNIYLSDIIDLTDPLKPNEDGLVVIPPEAFVLVRTLEYVCLPIRSKLAARVEGRS